MWKHRAGQTQPHLGRSGMACEEGTGSEKEVGGLHQEKNKAALWTGGAMGESEEGPVGRCFALSRV